VPSWDDGLVVALPDLALLSSTGCSLPWLSFSWSARADQLCQWNICTSWQLSTVALISLSSTAADQLLFLRSCRNASVCKSGIQNLTAVKRVFRYLKGTVKLHLQYEASDKDMEGYSDADWAADSYDRRSTSGNVFVMSNGAISWAS
jgi:hypothetical protein